MAPTFFSFLKQHKLPPHGVIRKLLARPLSWYGVALYALIASILIIAYVLILAINAKTLVTIPARGGTVTEGVIGAPHVINPVLASTQTDRDLVTLLYSGLMKWSDNASVAPDLAESYTVSPDGLTYTFILRDKLKWSDGKPLTASDIAFTISKLSNTALHSGTTWGGITVSSPDPRTVVFTLPTTMPDFLEQATVGILPAHIWSDTIDEAFDSAPANLHPVGSGPFRFASLQHTNGIPTALVLKRNAHYAHRHTFIDEYKVVFFANQSDLQDALDSGDVDLTAAADSLTASRVSQKDYAIEKVPAFTSVVLFQLRNIVLIPSEVAAILDQAIDKTMILDTVEHGYGVLSSTASETLTPEETFDALHRLGYTYSDGVLTKGGAPIRFSVAVENDPSSLLAARLLANEFSRFGITMTIKAFDYGTFHDVIRSNQYQFFVASIREDATPSAYAPLVSLYTTATPFIHARSLHISMPEYLDSPDERYLHVADWHTRTNKVWKPFSHNTNIISNNN